MVQIGHLLVWGFLNGIYLIIFMFFNKSTGYSETIIKNRFLPSVKEFFQIL